MADQEEIKTSPTRQKKKSNAGRKTAAQSEIKKIQDEQELKLLQEQQRQQSIAENSDAVTTLIDLIINKTILERFPDDLKEKGCKPLDEQETKTFSDALIPVLEKLGLLGGMSNPYLALAWTSYAIFKPRVDAYLDWKKEQMPEIEVQENKPKEKNKNDSKGN